MSHDAILKQLIPLQLGETAATDMELEGQALDAADSGITAILSELFADSAELLLSRWESIYDLHPLATDTLENRRAILIGKIRATGDIKKPYFISLAAAMGYTIYIDDYAESQSNWACADDELLEEPWDYFTAGCAMSGDYLAQENPVLPWIWHVVVTAVPNPIPAPDLETVLNMFKPAEIQINYTYL